MTLPTRLHRWIISSMSEVIKSASDGIPLPLLVEGIDENSCYNKNHAEFRFTGPFATTSAPGRYHIKVVGNILLTSYMDLDGSAYDLFTWAGTFQRVMLDPIPVYKYGDGGALLGCLDVVRSALGDVKIYHFGQVSKTDRVRQSEVDALYEMELSI